MTLRLRSLAVGMLTMVAIIVLNFTPLSSPAAATGVETKAYAAEVEAGLDYFRDLVAEQMPLVLNLRQAIAAGDLAAAKEAYVDARPPCEQIEVFAGSFEQEDSDIDARPYGFDEGESSSEFRGFHRIEAYLYRDGDLQAALPYADRLIESVKDLTAKLNDSGNFSAASNFEGMIAVATEVPAKKISSEEETWSDESILIFENNWKGIYNQYKPFAAQVSPALARQVDAAYGACMASIRPYVIPGQAGNKPYSSVSVGDRGKISAAAYELRNAILSVQDALGLS